MRFKSFYFNNVFFIALAKRIGNHVKLLVISKIILQGDTPERLALYTNGLPEIYLI